MSREEKHWMVEYSHDDGRHGTVEVITEIEESGAFDYGNGKCGCITVDNYPLGYDLRYCTDDDLHMYMLKDYFGKGLKTVTEI